MKIVAISDQHGHFPEIPECDLLLIAGDICPVRDHSTFAQMKFLSGPFADWIESVPARHVVGIAGNHDFIFQRNPELVSKSLRWSYLHDQSITIEGLTIYGTPWQPIFNDWAFNATELQLEQRWRDIPDQADILICHGPPHGYGDRNSRDENVGSPSLLRRILEVRPKLTVFGHIHEGRGRWDVDGITLANVTILDERYRLAHLPMAFEL